MACDWNSAYLLIFSDNVGPLIYYSHLLPLIASLFLGVFVILGGRRTLVHWVLFFITLMFSTWVYFDLILWASPSPESVIFFWSSIVPVELLIYASCLYLVYLFSSGQRDISLGTKVAIALFFIPIILFMHTGYNVLGLSPDCDVGAVEGPLIQYMYIVEIIYIVWAGSVATRAYRRLRDPRERSQLLMLSLGTIAFLVSFTAGNMTLIFSVDPLYEQYKLFGMPIFVALITYSAIKFNTFNLKIITAQALVVAVAILVFSMLFLRSIENVRVVAILTFALVAIIGYLLIRNVRKEIEQRVLIERQEKELEVVNAQQENLLHFISHEIKGYLTNSEAAFSAIAEGDYGPVTPQLQTMAEGGLANIRKGVKTVMDILKASDMKKGTVAYKKSQLDFKVAVENIVSEQRAAAQEKHLSLEVNIAEGTYTMEGDEEKLRDNVIRNLIETAIRYPPAGTVHIELSDGDGKIHFSVKDSGVGITPEDMSHLFTEGGHGKDSVKTNVHSTGYGLFIAKQVVDAHGGKIWAESEGEGKGARFVVELPAS